MKSRPPLPDGPYLVVGLARSGEAAARVLSERGAEVAGCDSGSPVGAARLAEAGIEVYPETDWVELLERTRRPASGVQRRPSAEAHFEQSGVRHVAHASFAGGAGEAR